MTPAERATRRVGELKAKGRGLPVGARESRAHATQVWEAARAEVAAKAAVLEVVTREAGAAALQGQIDLVLITAVAGHLGRCELCWRKWVDGYRPGDLLTAVIRSGPAGDIFKAVERETRAQARKQGRSP